MAARLTVDLMEEACMKKMREARDKGFTSALFPTLDEKIVRALTAMGFHVVEGEKGIFVNWDHPRSPHNMGIPVNISAHYSAEKADSFCYLSHDARLAYKARMAASRAKVAVA